MPDSIVLLGEHAAEAAQIIGRSFLGRIEACAKLLPETVKICFKERLEKLSRLWGYMNVDQDSHSRTLMTLGAVHGEELLHEVLKLDMEVVLAVTLCLLSPAPFVPGPGDILAILAAVERFIVNRVRLHRVNKELDKVFHAQARILREQLEKEEGIPDERVALAVYALWTYEDIFQDCEPRLVRTLTSGDGKEVKWDAQHAFVVGPYYNARARDRHHEAISQEQRSEFLHEVRGLKGVWDFGRIMSLAFYGLKRDCPKPPDLGPSPVLPTE